MTRPCRGTAKCHTGRLPSPGGSRPAVFPARFKARFPVAEREPGYAWFPSSSAAPGSQAPALRLVPKLQLGNPGGARCSISCANRSDFGTGDRPLNRLGLVRLHHPTTPGSQAPALRLVPKLQRCAWFPSSSLGTLPTFPSWSLGTRWTLNLGPPSVFLPRFAKHAPPADNSRGKGEDPARAGSGGTLDERRSGGRQGLAGPRCGIP